MRSKFILNTNQLPGEKSLDSWRELFVQYMREIDQEFDPGHRLDHVLRVTKTALELAEKEHANLAVVLPAAILHDSLPMDKFSKKRKDASALSAQNAIELLKKWQYPKEFHEAIYQAILCHSFSAGIVPQSLEAKVVQDADRLDALGAIGMARAMAVGFNHGNPLYDLVSPFPDQREADDQHFILDHFYIKLLNLLETLHTESAKEEAMLRIPIMEQYLQNLAREIGAEYLPFQQYQHRVNKVTKHAQVDIRIAGEKDCQELQNLMIKTWQETYRDYIAKQGEHAISQEIASKFSIEKIKSYLTDPNHKIWVVVTVFNEMVGYAHLALPDENKKPAFLHQIYIMKNEHGQGLGTRLLKQCYGHLGEKNISVIELEVDVDNTKAVAFYEKQGFKITKKVPYDEANAPGYYDYVMEKILLKSPGKYGLWVPDSMNLLSPGSDKNDVFSLNYAVTIDNTLHC